MCPPARAGWLKKNLTKSLAPTERTALVSRSETRICVKRQCELVEANRSSVYRRDKEEGKELSHGENAENLSLMRQLDELHMTYPAWGGAQADGVPSEQRGSGTQWQASPSSVAQDGDCGTLSQA